MRKLCAAAAMESSPAGSLKGIVSAKIIGAEERESVASLASVFTNSLGLADKVERAAAKAHLSGRVSTTRLEAQTHIMYIVEWTNRDTGEVWTNERRYSEFDKLRKAMLKVGATTFVQ